MTSETLLRANHLKSAERYRLIIGFVGATLLCYLPPLIFEEYTYYLYTLRTPEFFTFSGNRIWFDIGWFAASGAISALILGRKRWYSVVPPLFASAAFVASVYVEPLCFRSECYISSTDGLGPIRDFLLFASLGFLAANAAISNELFSSLAKNQWKSGVYALITSSLFGYALSFFPLMHIYAGVTTSYPFNLVQWFLAGAPPAFVGAYWAIGRGPRRVWFGFLCGISSVLLGMTLALDVPCSVCTGYAESVSSVLILGFTFALIGAFLGRVLSDSSRSLSIGAHMIAVVVGISVLLMWGIFLGANYQMSVVNNIGAVDYNSFSALEVGHSFVYSGGYLNIPRVTTKALGISVSFGNTSISSSNSNFLAAGVGVQSPNCCKDGLDLAYRVDAILFSNGTEALLARAWWACDENAACTGYSWQQLLHYGSVQLPQGTLSHLVDLEMNWTATGNVEWLYRIHFANGTTGSWNSYDIFKPPSIQNHYFDAGLLYVGPGNPPHDYAYFYQFGVSSAYPIESNDWNVLMQCPKLVINGTWTCVPSADFISGVHSFWKVLYTFGENYPGVSFRYEGNYTVSFGYSGQSPSDGTVIW
jgi:hypothetical protein